MAPQELVTRPSSGRTAIRAEHPLTERNSVSTHELLQWLRELSYDNRPAILKIESNCK